MPEVPAAVTVTVPMPAPAPEPVPVPAPVLDLTSPPVARDKGIAGLLERYGWNNHVKNETGLWVRVDTQELLVIRGNQVVRTYRCSTAARGTGSERDSEKTPLGWHQVGAKIGDRLPTGAILEERRWKGRVWRPGDQSDADLVLSRVLRLKGLEPGRNLGGNVDSWDRFIYIHGTNDVGELGRPSSHGCVRLSPTEIVELFDSVSVGCKVLITQ
jgi:lipoprotein-anchoring transpeptidase ErfK/SrfK